ncbi:MAG: insulinase family protein [Phycisphaerae bacterium]|nr:insulinase family protein [Phycisphaerae bacterium]
MKKYIVILTLLASGCVTAVAGVDPEIFVLENGMKFILLPRSEEPNSVAVGWVAKVGSVNERPGITGMSHFFEHLMFKGTNTVGTNNAEKDAEFTNTERVLRNHMLEIIWGEQYARFKLGEIDDPWDAKNDTPQLSSLRKELRETMESHRDVIVKDEFSSIYQGAGATGMNAFTSEDVTFYINQIPANKFELWCWMESDRLQNSVFREFFSERDVVHEERRMRTESTPTGIFQEQFNSMFWQASPYSWPVIGWPSDLNSYTLEEANRYFDVYYQPGNLVGVVVGDFELQPIKKLIVDYFGQLKEGDAPPPPVPTIEPIQMAPQLMVVDLDAQSRVEVRYHGVPFMHRDSFPLEVMSSILNGKTGRLYKALVEGKEIANSARLVVDTKKYAGAISFTSTVKGDASPRQLESAWYEQVDLLQNESVSEYELEKVKNNVVADQFRGLQSNFYLMIQLGYGEAIGGWEAINESEGLLLAVSADDIKRVANKYLTKNNSSVAIYNRSENAAPVDTLLEEELSAFSEEQQMMIKQALSELKTIPKEELLQTVDQMRVQAQQVPEEFKAVFDFLLKKLQERIDSLSGDPGAEEPTKTVVVEEVAEETVEENFVETNQNLELNAQQLAEATEFLASFQDKSLGELMQVEAALTMAATRVEGSDKVVLEYILARLTVLIAELENEN